MVVFGVVEDWKQWWSKMVPRAGVGEGAVVAVDGSRRAELTGSTRIKGKPLLVTRQLLFSVIILC